MSDGGVQPRRFFQDLAEWLRSPDPHALRSYRLVQWEPGEDTTAMFVLREGKTESHVRVSFEFEIVD